MTRPDAAKVRSAFKSTRFDVASGRGPSLARTIVDEENRNREKKVARLRDARLARDAAAAGLPPPEPSAKAKRKKKVPAG